MKQEKGISEQRSFIARATDQGRIQSSQTKSQISTNIAVAAEHKQDYLEEGVYVCLLCAPPPVDSCWLAKKSSPGLAQRQPCVWFLDG